MNNKYQKFIEKEESYSRKFLSSLQILDRNLNKKEYSFLELIFKNSELIDDIYGIIDDISSKEGIGNEFRYLIMGDFIFSMTSYDVKDPANLLFKTTRDDYIKKIRLRAVINVKLGCDYHKYILLHKKLLIGLKIYKILKKTEIRTVKDKIWNTTIYFQLTPHINLIESLDLIEWSDSPFILIDLEGIKYSLGSFRKLIKVKRKKREMEDIVQSYDSIIVANQTGLILSEKLHNINEKHIEEEKYKLLEKIDCKTTEEYFSKVEAIICDNNYTTTLLSGKEKISDLKYREIWVLKREINKEYIKIMSLFQKIIVFQLLKKDIFNKIFYLPTFMDNRSRQYYGGLLSPTFNKILRNLYELSTKKTFLDLENSIFYKKIIRYKDKVKIFNLDDKKSYIAIVLFIEIGKLFVEKGKYSIIKTEEIIECGIENYKNKNLKTKIDEVLYIEKIYQTIDRLIKENIIEENCLIFKDATASGLQNYGILLGYKKNMLKYLNIDSEDWCDTYQYIIERFLKSEDELKKRTYWKKTIMTIPYNAVWYKCFIDFLEELRKDGIEYITLSEEKKETLKEAHKNFYKKIKEDIKKEFYENNKKELKIFKYNKWEIINKKDYKINYKKARDKYTDFLYSIKEDEEATNRALEANNMHYLDAQLVKEVLKKFEVIPIHDCFGIRLCELHLIMDLINDYYSRDIGIKTYSIHIII